MCTYNCSIFFYKLYCCVNTMILDFCLLFEQWIASKYLVTRLNVLLLVNRLNIILMCISTTTAEIIV